MNFPEYQKAAARTANMNVPALIKRMEEKPELALMLNFALGLAGEAGEVADYIKKVVYHGHEMELAVVVKELGDVIWYWSQLARIFGLTGEEVAAANVEKLLKRYPVGFDEEASKRRVDVDHDVIGADRVGVGD